MALNLFGRRKQLTEDEKREIAQRMYVGAVPFVDRAYRNDPRTQIANNLMSQGVNTTPAVGGWTEGIARALSGVAGGYIGRQQRDKADIADKYWAGKANQANAPTVRQQAGLDMPAMDASSVVGRAAQDYNSGRINPNPPPTGPAMPPPAISPSAGMQQNPAALAQVAQNLGPQQGAPGASAMPANPPLPGLSPVSQPSIQLPAFQSAPASVAAPASPRSTRAARLNAITEYAESRGNPNAVSPKGARGLMQVMPATARDPGFGIRPSDGTPEDDVRLGEEYRAVMEDRYGGDLAKMWAAYNAGPGAVDRRIRRYGDNWLAYMPKETRDYVAANVAAAERDIPGGSAPSAPSVPQVQIPELPAAPTPVARPSLGERVRSSRLQIASRLLEDTDPENAAGIYALTQDLIDKGLTEDQASQIARDENESQLTNVGYQAALQNQYGQERDLFQQRIGERNSALTQRDLLARDAIQQQYEGENRRAEENNARERLRIEDRLKDVKVPVSVQNDFREALVTNTKIDTLLPLINDSNVGLLFLASDKITSRADPNGVRARAILSEIGSKRLHDRSGAAVTVEEFARQRGWYPAADDNAATVKTKLRSLAEGLRAEQDVILQMYGNAPIFQPWSGGQQGPVTNSADQALIDKYL